jgi:beta-glucanase (GH16 family)
MLPKHNYYGNWPASGEIDIVESRGNLEYPTGGVNTFGSTLHWGPFYPEDPFPQTHNTYTLPQGDFSEKFHVFGLVWSETGIQTYIDDPYNVVLNVSFSSEDPLWKRGGWDKLSLDNPWKSGSFNAPFDQEFTFVLNLAVGGTGSYWDDSVPNKPWKNTDSHAVNSFWNARNSWFPTWKGEDSALQIDYIRVYQTSSTR